MASAVVRTGPEPERLDSARATAQAVEGRGIFTIMFKSLKGVGTIGGSISKVTERRVRKRDSASVRGGVHWPKRVTTYCQGDANECT